MAPLTHHQYTGLYSPDNSQPPPSRDWSSGGKGGQGHLAPPFPPRAYGDHLGWGGVHGGFENTVSPPQHTDNCPAFRLSSNTQLHPPSFYSTHSTEFPQPFHYYDFDCSSPPDPIDHPPSFDLSGIPFQSYIPPVRQAPATCNPSDIMPRPPTVKRSHSQMSFKDPSSPPSRPCLGRADSNVSHSASKPPRSDRRQFKRPRRIDENPLSISNLLSPPSEQASQHPPPPTRAQNAIDGIAEANEGVGLIDLSQSAEDVARDNQVKSMIATQSAAATTNTSTSNAAATTPTNPPKQNRLQDFECCICMSPPTDLTMTPCGHLFCWECIHRAASAGQPSHFHGRGSSKLSKCPNCRKPFLTSSFGEKGLIPLAIKVLKKNKKKNQVSVKVVGGEGAEGEGLFVPEQGRLKESRRMNVQNGRIVGAPVIELD